MSLTVLYKDKWLAVAVKPVGVLSEDAPSGASMPALLREHFRAAGEPDFVATVHRLDKAVGGVMVFSRRPEITGRLTAAIRERTLEKEYLAVLRGRPAEPEARLTDLLFHDAAHNKSYVVKRPRKGVREAVLDYRELERSGELTLVRVRLHTGRTHQIRVQFASRGLPLLGDVRYGSNDLCTPALWSFRVAFPHPAAGRTVDVSCPPPAAYPWDLFGEVTP